MKNTIKKRNKISFISTLNAGKPEEVFVKIDAYQCRNGLAVGHLIKDDDGIYKYKAGWVVYHVKTGLIVKSNFKNTGHKTPSEAMRFIKNHFNSQGARLIRLLKQHENAQSPQCDCPAEIVGKLKAFPKPKPKTEKRLAGTEKFDGKKFAGLLQLIGQIDDARHNAHRTSEKQITFTIANSRFTIGAHLEALNRFRANVLKNRMAFADKSFHVKPECAPVVEAVKAECAKPVQIEARNLESNRMKPKCTLTEARKAELSARAAEVVANIMVKMRFNPKTAKMPTACCSLQ